MALALSAHAHHARANAWLLQLPFGDTVEFCRFTQISLLRLLTTTAVMSEHVMSNRKALEVYGTLLSDDRVRFCAEPASCEQRFEAFCAHAKPSPKRWMDGYLAAYAMSGGMRLVTFDRAFMSYVGLDVVVL
jgi:toxin-antitoxin system PIN domain toxin